ncbi:MAG: helix-turn-helix transcriptional regulator [Anaerolineales bacterium]|nr:helix-turn-helix transcriptional regulator [Anaerolineales bacterium]
MAESIGKRIAQLRKQHGLTQAALADWLAISRVAISHIEMDLTIPGERTITLMAGLFKLSPFELVMGTTYPTSKAERLPMSACCYTKLELDLELLNNDLIWLARIEIMEGEMNAVTRMKTEIRDKWIARLSDWDTECLNEIELKNLCKGREVLKNICSH